jgi:hypothetical protein
MTEVTTLVPDPSASQRRHSHAARGAQDLAAQLAEATEILEQRKAAMSAFEGLDTEVHEARAKALRAGHHPGAIPMDLRERMGSEQLGAELLEQAVAVYRVLSEEIAAAQTTGAGLHNDASCP